MLDSIQTPFDSVVGIVLDALQQPQKTLPAKLFYDDEGCRLFNAITELPEYYPTRVERDLLTRIVPQLPTLPGGALIEYGGCDETKALTLFDQLGVRTYVPIDVAGPALLAMATRLRRSRPELIVLPIAADFLQPFSLPLGTARQLKFGFFPGSTIGNLEPEDARRFLAQAHHDLGRNAHFLIGVDLRKDPAILVPAYDDAQGVTADFNRNMLVHLNRVAAASFEPELFDHRAVWNAERSRIEMHLVSRCAQTVYVSGRPISFRAGETIHTESSYKHTVDGFIDLAASAAWVSEAVWTDDEKLFSLHLLGTKEIIR